MNRTATETNDKKFRVVDLFSGAGGMSAGFHYHDRFVIIAAVDAQKGKPSSGDGSLQCNKTYKANMGLEPAEIDLSLVSPTELKVHLQLPSRLDVLAVCPPCTGFSRTNPKNHLRDDPRNSLVAKSAYFALEFDTSIVVMENARELIRGNFRHHYLQFKSILEKNGYSVDGKLYYLNRFGLPQIRERAIVIAVKKPLALRTLEDLWDGYGVREEATTVRRAIGAMDLKDEEVYVHPKFSSDQVRQRIAATPHDGGSWLDLVTRIDRPDLLTAGMKKILAAGRIGSYPDIYGRMWWDRPAPTIKRECSHVGNGRYAHPEQNRICTLREMAILQGFPTVYKLRGSSLSNLYRHLGDAVPPLISYQLAHLCEWMLTNKRPRIDHLLLPNTHLSSKDLKKNGTLQKADLHT